MALFYRPNLESYSWFINTLKSKASLYIITSTFFVTYACQSKRVIWHSDSLITHTKNLRIFACANEASSDEKIRPFITTPSSWVNKKTNILVGAPYVIISFIFLLFNAINNHVWIFIKNPTIFCKLDQNWIFKKFYCKMIICFVYSIEIALWHFQFSRLAIWTVGPW